MSIECQQQMSEQGVNNICQNEVSTTDAITWSQQQMSVHGVNNRCWNMVSTIDVRTGSQQQMSERGVYTDVYKSTTDVGNRCQQQMSEQGVNNRTRCRQQISEQGVNNRCRDGVSTTDCVSSGGISVYVAYSVTGLCHLYPRASRFCCFLLV